MPRAQGEELPEGVLLDDWLPQGTREALDDEASIRLARWRSRYDEILTRRGVCLPHIWEVELLAEVFLPETRIASGLAAVLAGKGVRRVELHALDPGRVACIRAVLVANGLEGVSAGGSAAAPVSRAWSEQLAPCPPRVKRSAQS